MSPGRPGLAALSSTGTVRVRFPTRCAAPARVSLNARLALRRARSSTRKAQGLPALASGWFAGLSEAYLKRPRVVDFERIPEDIMSVRGFWRNPITRILMVVVLTNLGSTAGALLAMPILTRIMLAG